jgi:GT2 family glycosyltransferase
MQDAKEGAVVTDRVVIGYVHGGTVRAEFLASMLAVMRLSQVPVEDVIAVGSGPNISRSRNLLVGMFLEDHDAPWLFMADTDMVFRPDVIDRLVAASEAWPAPIIGGLCFSENPGGDPLPTLYELVEVDGSPAFTRLERWPDDGLVRVSATGAACLLVHRDALESVAKASGDRAAPWFRESVVGSSLIGEDMTFCLRAGAAGIPVHVHTGVKVGHVKTRVL